MESLPKDFTTTNYQMRVVTNQGQRHVAFNGSVPSYWGRGSHNVSLLTQAPTVARLFIERQHTDANSLTLSQKDSEIFFDIEKDTELLEEEIQKVKTPLAATLDKFTTISKLCEAWPEIADIARTFNNPPKPKPSLPSVDVKSLNNLLDLPPDSEAA